MKLFITGATGYIGGDALHQLYATHPEWSYALLVRSEAKASPLRAAFPTARIVIGDLSESSPALLEAEASAADVILHCASADIVPGAEALVAGARSASSPVYLIHTSGTGILIYEDMDEERYGERGEHVWDDVADIREVISIPDHAMHREVDKIVLAASEGAAGRVKTAVVCPPTIYGKGRGVGNTRSVQVPGLAKAMLERKAGFFVGKGEALWSHVHVRDLSEAYVLLAEAAAQELQGGKSAASWNETGYYFTEAGEHVWGEVSREMARKAHAKRLLARAECESVSPEELRDIFFEMWATNSRCRASRFRQMGWKPTAPGLTETIDDVLRMEDESLGQT